MKEGRTGHVDRDGTFMVGWPAVHGVKDALASGDGSGLAVPCSASLVAGQLGSVEIDYLGRLISIQSITS